MARVASLECEPWRDVDAPTGATVVAAVRCQVDEGGGAPLTLMSFSEGVAVRDAWSAQVDAIQPSLEESSDACDGATVGMRRWGFGRLACWVEDDSATISWTDSRSHLLGTVQRAGPDAEAALAWWQENGRRLGRVAAEGASSSEPDADRPLVRVPGAPDEVICTDMDEPIVDSHSRTWQVQRVRFLGRPDAERVVFLLQRTGRVRPGRGAEVSVDRMPVTEVVTEVPGASRPGRGSTALVVRMQGVTQAPDLRAYRPEGLGLVKELSIVRGNRSRTAILSLTGTGCFQVRVPVFGPSASGDEDRAEVFIDIPRVD
jgi:hypothetical protein